MMATNWIQENIISASRLVRETERHLGLRSKSRVHMPTSQDDDASKGRVPGRVMLFGLRVCVLPSLS